jgi:hypothetical protein
MLTLLLCFCKCLFSGVCGKIPVDYSFLKLCFLAFIHSSLVMPYSNWRRHNSSGIPQTPYQTLIIPCPNFDPIYQVILLENSNEWNLSLAKEASSKRERGRSKYWKKKRWNLSWKATCFEKKRKDEIYKLLGEILSKERKEITIFYSAKSDVWPHPYPHIICICTTFYSLTFLFLTPFTTPFSINHDYLPHKLSRIFLCFYNIQGVASVPLESEATKNTRREEKSDWEDKWFSDKAWEKGKLR